MTITSLFNDINEYYFNYICKKHVIYIKSHKQLSDRSYCIEFDENTPNEIIEELDQNKQTMPIIFQV